MIGETNAALRRALADVPAEMTTTVERIGSHATDGSVVDELLTDRQREVASAAVDLGYYEVPRAATLTEVADRVGLSVATVGEHLQKVESRLIGRLLR
jgi:predicted DNA binding protein